MNSAKRLATAFFLLSTLITMVIYSKTFASLFASFGFKDYSLLGREFTTSTLTAVLVAAATLYYFLKFTRAWTFVNESSEEILRVTWPTMEDNKKRTIQTFTIVTIVGVILFAFDIVFRQLTDFLLSSR